MSSSVVQSMISDHSDLVHIDPMQAVYIKFDRGREEHGRGEWVGSRRPLSESHDEVLDAIAYLIQERSASDVDTGVIDALVVTLLDVLQGIRTAICVLEENERASLEVQPPEELVR